MMGDDLCNFVLRTRPVVPCAHVCKLVGWPKLIIRGHHHLIHSKLQNMSELIRVKSSAINRVYRDSPGIPNNNKLPEYCSLMKEHPWAEHHTDVPKRGVGTLLSVSAFNHKRVPKSCLQRLDALEANNLTIMYNRITSGFQVES